MKSIKRDLLTIILLLVAFIVTAQSNYSPCYTNNMANGDAAFSQGKYSEARTYYANAKKCNGGNPSAAQQKINSCDAKIKAQNEARKEEEIAKKRAEKEAAEEAKRKADQAAAEEKKRKAEQKAEEARRLAEQKAREKAEEARRKTEDSLRLILECKTMEDYDGNTYALVKIGKQCWMAENLRVTHFADGTEIPFGKSCTTYYFNPNYFSKYYPGNNNRNVSTYGYLYDWVTTMHGEYSSNSNPSGVQGICPTGWHVPSEAEWNQLQEYINSQSQYFCDGKSKNTAKALASTTGWRESKSSCTPGNMMQENNASGFNAVPAGRFNPFTNELFNPRPLCFSEEATFWTSTAEKPSLDPYGARMMHIDYNEKDMRHGVGGSNPKVYGYSVRCLRD